MPERLSRALNSTHQVAWALLILLLPFTSLPLMAHLVSSVLVAAPSGLPLAWLVVFFLVPFLITRGRFPSLILPLLGFASTAVISSALAWFQDVPVFKSGSLLSRELQALVTLGIGLAFYLVTCAWLKNESRRVLTFRLVNITGLIILLWSTLQAAVVFTMDETPLWLNELQAALTLRPLYFGRVNGFAFEPSWLAHQLNMLFLPYWLAATVQRSSAWSKRVFGISAENVLLVLGIAVLFLSFSRVGLLAFLLVVAYLFLRANARLASRISNGIAARRKSASSGRLVKTLIHAGLLAVFLLVYLAGAVGIAAAGSKIDPRLAHLFEKPEESIFTVEYANQLAFAERMIYWATGWEIFNDHPLVGVGLGAAGYYFPEEMPPFGWYLPEIRELMYRAPYIPNTKSLWSRLLAETGLLGFSLFLVWMYLLWQGARFLRYRQGVHDRTVGLMGAFVLVGMLVEGFSVDSFALPYWWISLGIVTAAAGQALNILPNHVEYLQIERGEEHDQFR